MKTFSKNAHRAQFFFKLFSQKNRNLRILSFTFSISALLLSLDWGKGDEPEELQWKYSYVHARQIAAFNW